jgi:hypothetical protein
MRLPETLAQINAELGRRAERGECFEVVEAVPEVLRDIERGLFLRVRVFLSDRTTFSVDSLECSELLLRAQVH